MNARPDPGSMDRPLLRLPPASQDAPPMHDARRLTAGGVQARIHLDGQIYALRITRAGKLILTK